MSQQNSCLQLFLLINFLHVALSQTKPNILLLVVDDLGWTDISYHGAEYTTPNFDQLYLNGIELTNYYVQPTCSPTRSSIMTGKYTWKTGLQKVSTIAPGTTEHIPFEFPTMPELLKKAGYSTHMLGKWHLGYASFNMTPTGRGFDSHFGYYQGEETYYDHYFWYEKATVEGFDFWSDKNVYFDAINHYSTDLYAQQMETIISNHVNSSVTNPLFIYMSFQTIHIPVLNFDGTPENPPKTYDECMSISNVGRQTYCNKIKYLDEQIGAMIGLYRKYSLYDNTLFVLSTDNGGMTYHTPNQTNVTRGTSWGCNWPLRGGKATRFQGGIKGIGLLAGNLIAQRGLNGTKSDILLHAMDWLATFIEGIAEGELPNDKKFDSINMWDAIGDNKVVWNRTTLYADIQVSNAMYCIINDSLNGHVWKLINGSQFYYEWYLCNETVVYGNTENIYLFDIQNDPYEENNLYSKYPSIAKELDEMIREQIIGGEYYPEQSGQIYEASYPELHDGVWAPWLN